MQERSLVVVLDPHVILRLRRASSIMQPQLLLLLLLTASAGTVRMQCGGCSRCAVLDNVVVLMPVAAGRGDVWRL
jgi:hypothetical protein